MSQQQSGYTIRQTAELLKVSVQRIHKLVKTGYLAVFADNGQTYVLMPSLAVYIQRRLGELQIEQKKYKNALKNLLNPIDNKVK